MRRACASMAKPEPSLQQGRTPDTIRRSSVRNRCRWRFRWLGVERAEGQGDESMRPAWRLRTVFRPQPKSRPGRSQSAHSSDEVPVMGMERRGAGRWSREAIHRGRPWRRVPSGLVRPERRARKSTKYDPVRARPGCRRPHHWGEPPPLCGWVCGIRKARLNANLVLIRRPALR